MATVKFLHPGAQWTSQLDQGTAPWTTVEQGHARRYLQTGGQFLRSPGGPLEEGQIGFWGEYEAPTTFRRLAARPAVGLPEFVHTPLPLSQAHRPADALNTDPLVLGSPWLYSNCRQRSLPGLRRLGPGDVILFGSLVRRTYVLDTVFVVAEAMPYRGGQAHEMVGARVPSHAHHLVMDLLWPGEYSLYLGATYENPVQGRFSFVPAVPASARQEGFARPAAPPSLQSQQAMGIKFLEDPTGYFWTAAVRAVLGQGCCLGVRMSLPVDDLEDGCRFNLERLAPQDSAGCDQALPPKKRNRPRP